MARKNIPIPKGNKFDSAITANTDIFGSNLIPSNTPALIRIMASFNAEGILNVKIIGGTTVTLTLNDNIPLTANCVYIFDIIVDAPEAVNLQYSVNAQALKVSVIEVAGDS